MSKRTSTPVPGASVPAPLHPEARRAIAALPSHVRYLDEYDDEWKAIAHPAENDRWPLEYDTTTATLDFSRIQDPCVKRLAKHFIIWSLHNRSPGHANKMFQGIRQISSRLGELWFLAAIDRHIFDWQVYWDTHWRNVSSQTEVHVAKLLLHFLCEMCLGEFRPGHAGGLRALASLHMAG